MPTPLEEIIDSEGISPTKLPPGVLKGNEFLNASEHFFRFILGDTDPRWLIIARFIEARQSARFQKIHVENALSAIYLSDQPSYRNGYSSFGSTENMRHLCRAVNNLAALTLLNDLYEQTADSVHLPDSLSFEFARSNRILSGTDRRGITGSPEALYQLRMFHDGKYFARIGFNSHQEGDANVLSVTNIQGVPHTADCHAVLQERGIKPFNSLVRRLVAMSDQSPEPMLLRGLKNPAHLESSGLYNATFKSERIPRYHFRRINRIGRQDPILVK